MSSLGSLLAALAEERGWSRRWDEERAVSAAGEVLGPVLGAHARAVAVRKGTLVLEVEHPVWGGEILLHKNLLVDRVNAAVGRPVVEDVRVLRAPVRRSPSRAGFDKGRGGPRCRTRH